MLEESVINKYPSIIQINGRENPANLLTKYTSVNGFKKFKRILLDKK